MRNPIDAHYIVRATRSTDHPERITRMREILERAAKELEDLGDR